MNKKEGHDRRKFLALSGSMVLVGASGCLNDEEPEDEETDDDEEAETELRPDISEEDLSRTSEAGGVSFEAKYVNPLLETDEERDEVYGDGEDDLFFEVQMDTHTGDLTQYDWSERARLLTDTGTIDATEWVWVRQSDHHPEGYYRVSKNELFTDETGEMELRIRSVNEEEVRFGWSLTDYTQEAEVSSLVRAYVADSYDGTVSVVDHSTASVVETVEVADSISHGIAATPDGDKVFVGDGDTGDLYPIATEDFDVEEPIEIDGDAHGVDIHPDGRYVYVSEGGLGDEGGVIVVDVEERTVVERIETGGAGHVNFDNEGRYVYISNVGDDGIAVVSAEDMEVVAEVTVGEIPNEAVASPDGSYVYTANIGDDSVSVIEAETWEVVDTIENVSNGGGGTSEGAHGIDVTPDGERIFVASRGAGIVVIDADTREITGTVDVGGSANHIRIESDGDYAYVTSMRDEEVAVIDTDSLEVVWRVEVGAEPHEIAFVSS